VNINRANKAKYFSINVIGWFMIRMVITSIGIIIPVIAVALLFKGWTSGAEVGLFLIYAI